MSKPKIAFVLPALNMGGAQRVVTVLANVLIKNYQVFIITFTNTKVYYELDNNITILNCTDSIRPSTNGFVGIKNNLYLLKRIHAIIKENNIDLLISFLTSANILTTLVAKFNNLPVIISERNNPYSQKVSRIWGLMRQITYPKADFVIVQTETIKSFYSSKIKEDRLIILPNPIAPELTQKRIGNFKKENIILNAGRLTNQKAQDILIRAFALTENKGWKLVIAGEGPNRKKFEHLIKELKLESKVFLPGRQKNIHDLYNRSKIFAFSSIFEGFPNALIEAMHFGLACVSTDCPTGPSELIEHGKNGYLVPMNNPTEFAKKLNKLMNDDRESLAFGRNAINAVEKLEAKNVVKLWEKLIKSGLSSFK